MSLQFVKYARLCDGCGIKMNEHNQVWSISGKLGKFCSDCYIKHLIEKFNHTEFIPKDHTLCYACMSVIPVSEKHKCPAAMKKPEPTSGVEALLQEKEFNEPSHYHQHEIDTITFLQKGFPPSVFQGFAIGSVIKYLHRYEHKNGMEDLIKAADFANRLITFHKENGGI